MCAVDVQPLLQSNNSKTAFQHEQERITESNCYCVRFFWLLNWWFYSMIIIDLFVLNIDLLVFFFFSYFTFVSPFSLLPHLTVERKNVIIAHLAQSKTHAPFWMLNVKRKRTSLFFTYDTCYEWPDVKRLKKKGVGWWFFRVWFTLPAQISKLPVKAFKTKVDPANWSGF